MRAAVNNVSLLLSSQYLSQSLRLSAVPIRRAHFLLLLRQQPPSSESGRRTLGILAPADLDELLDVGNFGRHLDDLCVDGSLEFGIVKFGDEFGQCRCPGVDELASNARATKGCPQALLLWAWWGDDVRGVNQEGSGEALHETVRPDLSSPCVLRQTLEVLNIYSRLPHHPYYHFAPSACRLPSIARCNNV